MWCKNCIFGIMEKVEEGEGCDNEAGLTVTLNLNLGTCDCCYGKWWNCDTCSNEEE